MEFDYDNDSSEDWKFDPYFVERWKKGTIGKPQMASLAPQKLSGLWSIYIYWFLKSVLESLLQ